MSDITKLLDHLKELEIWGETFKKIESNIFFSLFARENGLSLK